MGRIILWGGTALAVGLCAGGGSAGAQSLSQSVENALSGNCADLGPAAKLGPQLALLCTSIPAFTTTTAPDGGSPEGLSSSAVQGEENQVRKRLQDLRDKKSGMPSMTQYADASGSGGTFDLPQLSGYFNFDYQNVSKDTTYFTPGFNSNRYRGTFGADHSWDNAVLGLSFEYGHTDGDFSGGGNFDSDRYGGTLYGSVTPAPGWFFDGALGYAHEDLTINRAVAFSDVGNGFTVAGTSKGTPGVDEYRASLDGGYDFYYQNFTYGPRFGMAYAHRRQGHFSESGSTGLELSFGDEDFESITSTFGAKASMAISTSFGVLVPQVEADWIHEYNNNQQTFTASFVQDLKGAPTPLVFQTDNPHRDYAGLSAGVVLGLPHGISSFLTYRALVGNPLATTQTVTAGVRFEF
ncbi:MAG TPA: autotransporter outer membrane beta-barrel domain-containing protein [Stellaceae bacterium]|nr:autotransporter outer membrane beta-barrel domain-containing protein [Stellaceae bacterium]